MYLPAYLSIYLYICLILFLYMCLCIHGFGCLCVYICIHVSWCLCVYMSMWVLCIGHSKQLLRTVSHQTVVFKQQRNRLTERRHPPCRGSHLCVKAAIFASGRPASCHGGASRGSLKTDWNTPSENQYQT